MHELYVAPTRAYADLVLVSDGAVETCLQAVCSTMKAPKAMRP